MRRFILQRNEDVTGVSGTGLVVEGIQFSDGRCAYRWFTKEMPQTTVLADCIEDVVTVHGHGGKTRLIWIDTGDQEMIQAALASSEIHDLIAAEILKRFQSKVQRRHDEQKSPE